MKDGEVYKKRIIDDVLRRKLSGSGAVLVEGPRFTLSHERRQRMYGRATGGTCPVAVDERCR